MTLQGALLKKVYGELSDPVAPEKSIARDIKFVPADKQNGLTYDFPVHLSLEQGVTHNLDHSSFTLNQAVDGTYQNVSLDGAEIAVRAQLSYGEMTKLSKTKGESAKAYDQGLAVKILNTTESGEQRREMQILYGAGTTGAANIGAVSAIAVAAAGGVVTINISRASFIPGFWQEFRFGAVDVFSAGGAQRNVNALLQVTGVNRDQARIQLTGNAADAAAIVAGDVIFFRGARTLSAFGVQAILENTGNLFGIDAGTVPQWRAVQYPVGGTLTFDKVIEGITAAADNGLDGGTTLYVCNRSWADLMTDEVALRRYSGQSSDKKASPGFAELEFMMPCGPVKIKQHRYIKQGLAFALPTDQWHRIGSTDLTFTAPGNKDEYFYVQQANNAGAEIRIYSDQALVSEKPFQSVEFTGIQNSADVVPS